MLKAVEEQAKNSFQIFSNEFENFLSNLGVVGSSMT